MPSLLGLKNDTHISNTSALSIFEPSGICRSSFSVVKRTKGFTLIELVVVIMILAIVATLVLYRAGSFTYWQEEGFIRRFSETLIFLHHQAVADQAYYQVEFDFEKNSYQVNVLRPEEEANAATLAQIGSDAGVLSLELAAYLNPSVGRSHTLIPPPTIPSLAQPIFLPPDCSFEDIRTMRGQYTPKNMRSKPYVLFSPRGFSEFAVIHLRLSRGSPVTIMVNPFSGLTEIYREYRDFEWTYGRKKAKTA